MNLDTNHSTSNRGGFASFVVFSFLLLSVVAFDLFTSMSPVLKLEPKVIAYCDSENVKEDQFVCDKRLFAGAAMRTDVRSLSGSHSLHLHGDKTFGYTIVLDSLQKGGKYKISVWTYPTSGDRGLLVFSHVDSDEYYLEERLPTKVRADGWQLLTLIATIPPNIKSSRFKVYVYIKKGSGPVFFDDLLIESMQSAVITDEFESENFETPKFNIEIEQEELDKLEKKKWDAVSKGNLFVENDDWVEAELNVGNSLNFSSKIRLKGDWLDHLAGRKWSFRIKLKSNQYWRGMNTFSVQSTHTRSHLIEWFYHEWMKKEDILCPRYNFVTLTLNGELLGQYAYEEHFSKHLVESQSRREGPIIKFTEDQMWLGAKRARDLMGENLIPEQMPTSFHQAQIVPFDMNKTLEDTLLKKHFSTARNLLTGFKNESLGPSEVFDLKRVAKWFAIVDILNAYHSLTWHNLRYYFNPITIRLEPIGFDGFGVDHSIRSEKPFLAYHHSKTSDSHELYKSFLDSPEFMNYYTEYLFKFSSDYYIKNLLSGLQNLISSKEVFITKEYHDYAFEQEEILRNTRRIQTYLFPFHEDAVKGYYSNDILTVTNSHSLPVQVLGYQLASVGDAQFFERSKYIPSTEIGSNPEYIETKVAGSVSHIFYKVGGIDSILYSSVLPIDPPRDRSSIKSRHSMLKRIERHASIIGDSIIFSSGNLQITELLVIPPGFVVFINTGTSLDLIEGGGILSYSSINVRGNKENPVRITSSDLTNNGISIFQVSDTSKIDFVELTGLNALHKENWSLTGALSVYENPILLKNVKISDNLSEDALNIVRSHFEINNMKMTSTAFDGFDADFCKGTIEDSYFNQIGNDALDFSGSQIDGRNLHIVSAQDKGISIGEASVVSLDSVFISESNVGLASKDLSEAYISNSSIINCTTGYTAYQKKPEFGSAKIDIHNPIRIDANHRLLVETGSSIKINGSSIK